MSFVENLGLKADRKHPACHPGSLRFMFVTGKPPWTFIRNLNRFVLGKTIEGCAPTGSIRAGPKVWIMTWGSIAKSHKTDERGLNKCRTMERKVNTRRSTLGAHKHQRHVGNEQWKGKEPRTAHRFSRCMYPVLRRHH